MQFNIEKVFERDIDLLMIDRFISNNELLNFFLKKVGLSGYRINSIEHSNMDVALGESDITIIVENADKKVGILIEDKIDAQAMELQPERYEKRGNKGIENHLYDEFRIFIIAPQKYLNDNIHAKKYPNKISYEEIIEILHDDFYAIELLKTAIKEKERGYTVIENKLVTNFWKKYFQFVRDNYPMIRFNDIDTAKGSRAKWIEFLTDYKQVKIVHKTEKGYLDLTFNGMGKNIEVFNKYIKNKVPLGCMVATAGKSMVIRRKVPIIDVNKDFNNFVAEMNESMEKTIQLYNDLAKINVVMMYNDAKK